MRLYLTAPLRNLQDCLFYDSKANIHPAHKPRAS